MNLGCIMVHYIITLCIICHVITKRIKSVSALYNFPSVVLYTLHCKLIYMMLTNRILTRYMLLQTNLYDVYVYKQNILFCYIALQIDVYVYKQNIDAHQ